MARRRPSQSGGNSPRNGMDLRDFSRNLKSVPQSWALISLLVVASLFFVYISSSLMPSSHPCQEQLNQAEQTIAQLQNVVRELEARAVDAEQRASRAVASAAAAPSAGVDRSGRQQGAAQGGLRGSAGKAVATVRGSCLPKSENSEDDGYVDEYRGWFDVQDCGYCYDYCRWIGDSGPGGDPAVSLRLGHSWWSCRLAGTGAKHPGTNAAHFKSWTFAKCTGEGAASPGASFGGAGLGGAAQLAPPRAPPPAPPPPPGKAVAASAPVEVDDADLIADASGPRITEDQLKGLAAEGAIGVAMIVCKRPNYLKRTMMSVLSTKRDAKRFPLVISQDANDAPMSALIEERYVSRGVAFKIQHQHEAGAEEVAKKFGKAKSTVGYVRIAQHFGFAMRMMFDQFGFEAVIFVEEDMEVAPDFFSYFGAMLPILQQDQDLFCVSAWNDNGHAELVMDPQVAFRTDFFPGLGWMMQKSMWGEVRDRWAIAFWDEFMRRTDVRKGRHCIRPDISRSYTFGSEGTSSGQFFKSHLSRIRLNSELVDWASLDLSYLATAQAFDEHISDRLRAATFSPLANIDGIIGQSAGSEIRIEYRDKKYKEVAKRFSLMEDEKEGIRRMSYRGVIPFAYRGIRVFLYTEVWPGDL